MTNQEAIDELQYAIDLIKQDGKDWIDERDIPILETAIHALEKQIPMKTLPYEMGLDGKIIIPCGNCESTLDGIWDYCPYCGQNILWRAKDDKSRGNQNT